MDNETADVPTRRTPSFCQLQRKRIVPLVSLFASVNSAIVCHVENLL